MIKILTENKEEYREIKKMLNNAKSNESCELSITICKPENCKAVVMWSVDDVMQFFPQNTPIYIIEKGLKRIEDTIKEDMTSRGWDTIDVLQDEMLSIMHEGREKSNV